MRHNKALQARGTRTAMTSDTPKEGVIDPHRPIIDPHLHHWEIPAIPGLPMPPHRFLLHEALAAVAHSGHNITHSVFVECHAMYRADGPPEFAPLGETEFANGIAAMSASGSYGPRRLAHRIVGSANLTLGSAVRPVLEAHQAVAGERFRGIRLPTAYSAAGLFGRPCDPDNRGIMLSPAFRDGARVLAEMGLSLDVWCLHTQLAELTDLADALPMLTIVLNHLGTPERLGAYAGREQQAFEEWRDSIRALARRPNVFVKLGGLGMDITTMVGSHIGCAPSEALATEWRPLIETAIEAFSPERAMFESNFPPDNAAGSYGATWNTFKIIAQGCSEPEKDALFRRTAASVYHIALDDAPLD